MLTGRDFSKFGSQYDVLNRIGDGNGDPVEGPIHVRWIGNESIAVIGPEREVAFLTAGGRVATLFRNGIAIEEAEKLKQTTGEESKKDKDGEEVHYEYWFEDPIYVMSKEEKDAKAREQAELEKTAQANVLFAPTKRTTLQIVYRDICRVPDHDTQRLAIACEYSNSVKLVARERGENWEEVQQIGSKYITNPNTGMRKPGMFNTISGVDCLRVEDGSLYFTCDEGNNRIQVLDDDGTVIRSLEGEGPGNTQFRSPCSISVYLVRRAMQIKDGEQEEKELAAKIAALEALKRLEEIEKEAQRTGRIIMRKKSFAVGLGRVRKEEVELHESRTGFDHKDVLEGEDLDKLKSSAIKNKQGYESEDSDDSNNRDPSEYIPSWYLGFADQHDLISHLRTHKSSGKPGDFAVARRIDDSNIYDLYYLAKDQDAFGRKKGAVVKLVLRKQEEDPKRGIKNAGVFLSTTTQESVDKLYPSIWDFIKSRPKELSMTAYDPRPHVLIAVADKNNYRVQIFKYFWTFIPAEPDLYSPSLEYFATIGGRKRSFMKLTRPTCVSYSPTGELVVVDADKGGKVYLLSQYFALIKNIDVPFSSQKSTNWDRKKAMNKNKNNGGKNEEEEEELNFLNGGKWPYWRKAKQVLLDSDGVAIVADELSLDEKEKKLIPEAARAKEKNAKWMGKGKSAAMMGGLMKGGTGAATYLPPSTKGTTKTLDEYEAEEEQRRIEAVLPVSASFSANGTLVVGYRNGGLFIYRPYKNDQL